MTKLKNPLFALGVVESAFSDFSIDIRRAPRGMAVVVCGVISVFELTEQTVGILTKRARVYVVGKRLALSVFECRRVEISGTVEDISFKYGRG